MPGIMKKNTSVLNFIKNKKGQGIVEFALVLALCAGIGLAAREAGLLNALNDSYSSQQADYAPADIEKNKATVSGNIAAVADTGGGTNASDSVQNQADNSKSSEVSAFDALQALKNSLAADASNITEQEKNAIWEAYKGENVYEDDNKVKRAALALLNAENVTDVDDEYWMALKEAMKTQDGNPWAFDDDDKAIYNFLTDPANSSLTADELKIRNTYFAALDTDTINLMKTNGSDKAFYSENSDDIDNIYLGYLAIKKQFWPNSVSLSLSPLITDEAFNATSDERRIYNYLNGVNGAKGLKDYFAQFIPNSDDKDDIVKAKVAAAFAINGVYTVDDDHLKAMLTKGSIAGLADVFKEEIDSNHNLDLDTDEQTVHAFLSGKDVNDVQARNKYFADMDTTVIGKMKDAADRSDGSYDGYLAMKKQFGFETIPAETLNNFAPLISTDGNIADEKKVFDFVKGLKDYFNGLNESDAKVWRAFALNGQYSVAGVDATTLAAMLANADGNIANVDDAFWSKVKENHGWAIDKDDETIKKELKDFVDKIKDGLGGDANDADKVVEELVKRQAQFKVIGSTDAGKATIKKMISNMTEDKLNADAYKGYLAIKKQFWAKGEYNIALSPLSSAGGSNIPGVPSNIQLDKEPISVSDSGNFSEVLTKRGDVFTYNGKCYVCTSYYIGGMNKDNLGANAAEISFDNPKTDSDAINDNYVHFPQLDPGTVVLSGQDGKEVWVVIQGGNYFTPPFSTGNNGCGVKIGTKVD